MACQPAPYAPPRDDFSLAFVNTRYWRGRPTPSETLAAPADLAAWWRGETGQHIAVPDTETFNAALDLRECLHRLFAARAQQRTPASGDVTALNNALAEAPARRTLALAGNGLAWAVEAPAAWPTARAALLWSAADLLTGPRRDRVRQCDNPDAATCSSTPARPARAAGATCPRAAIAPRRTGIIGETGRTEVRMFFFGKKPKNFHPFAIAKRREVFLLLFLHKNEGF